MIDFNKFQLWKSITKTYCGLLCISIFLSGCISEDSGIQFTGLGAPEPLRRSLAVDLDNVEVMVTINGGAPMPAQRLGNDLWVVADLNRNDYITLNNIRIVWSEQFGAESLMLAEYSGTFELVDNVSIDPNGSYITTGEQFDVDADGVSNLDEINLGTDPFIGASSSSGGASDDNNDSGSAISGTSSTNDERFSTNLLTNLASSLRVSNGCVSLIGSGNSSADRSEPFCADVNAIPGLYTDSVKGVVAAAGQCPVVTLYENINWTGLSETFVFCDSVTLPSPTDGVTQLPEMVNIPTGCFDIGSPEDEPSSLGNENPQFNLCFDAFSMSKYEITFAEFDEFAQAAGRTLPGDGQWGRNRRPVINVSWTDANAYVAWLSERTGRKYRLPTEVEWEYAARAGTSTPFHTGDIISTDQANFNGTTTYNGSAEGNFRQQTIEVGTFSPNSYGLYDMHGNAAEWTCSQYEFDYRGRERTCIVSPTLDDLLSFRGGSYRSEPSRIRSGSRNWASSNFIAAIGIRMVLEE